MRAENLASGVEPEMDQIFPLIHNFDFPRLQPFAPFAKGPLLPPRGATGTPMI